MQDKPSRILQKCLRPCTIGERKFWEESLQYNKNFANDMASALLLRRLEGWHNQELWKQRKQKAGQSQHKQQQSSAGRRRRRR